MKPYVEESDAKQKHFSPFGYIYNLPYYLFRRTSFFLLYSIVFGVSLLSRFVGFHFDYSFDEKSRWKWSTHFNWPRPFVGLKKE